MNGSIKISKHQAYPSELAAYALYAEASVLDAQGDDKAADAKRKEARAKWEIRNPPYVNYKS